jgi:hypothetical protein
LFAPERVAVVGATDSEGSVGHAVTTNLLDSFTGEVVAVNPNKETVLGLPCYDNLADIDDPASVDVAVAVGGPDVAAERPIPEERESLAQPGGVGQSRRGEARGQRPAPGDGHGA